MPAAIFSAFEFGIIYAIMALGVYISFRILDFPDLTVDGSFVTGASVAATLIVNGTNPILATVLAMLIGFLAGCITGLLHTVCKINSLLSGILMMIGLYSVNLRIMGKSNVPLMSNRTIFTDIDKMWEPLGIDKFLNNVWTSIGLKDAPTTWSIIFFMAILVLIIKFALDKFLKTEIGLALRATGDNPKMIKSFSANTNILIVLGLGLSNALVALSGAIVAQYGKFSDAGMGIGIIIIGLASVIIGEAIFGKKTIFQTTFAVIGGAIVYRIVVALALRVEFLETGDMKLITATIVVIALVLPKYLENYKNKKKKSTRIANYGNKEKSSFGREDGNASTK